MNVVLKTGISAGLDGLGLPAAMRYYRAPHSGIVLTLHRVLPEGHKALSYDPHLVLSEHVFDALLTLLANEFEVVGLNELVQQPGSKARRQRVAITFDDGWEDTYSIAFPLLKKHGFPATVFICSELTRNALAGAMLPEERFALVWRASELRGDTIRIGEELRCALERDDRISTRASWSQKLKSIPMDERCGLLEMFERQWPVKSDGRRRLMTWDEARAMTRNNIMLGSHTRRHCTLPSESDASALQEMAISRDEITAETGASVDFLAYPNGAHCPRTVALAQQSGFTHAFAASSGFVTRETDSWTAPRFAVEDSVIADGDGKLSKTRARAYLQKLI